MLFILNLINYFVICYSFDKIIYNLIISSDTELIRSLSINGNDDFFDWRHGCLPSLPFDTMKRFLIFSALISISKENLPQHLALAGLNNNAKMREDNAY